MAFINSFGSYNSGLSELCASILFLWDLFKRPALLHAHNFSSQWVWKSWKRFLQCTKPPQTIFVNLGIFNVTTGCSKTFLLKRSHTNNRQIHKIHTTCTISFAHLTRYTSHIKLQTSHIFPWGFVNPAIVIYSRNNVLVIHCLAQCGKYSIIKMSSKMIQNTAFFF